MTIILDQQRLLSARRAYSTRNITEDDLCLLWPDAPAPRAGDLVLARVLSIGNHKAIELTSGRRAALNEGDEVILAYGNRYAPDQYEAEIPLTLEACDLVAAGGIASKALSWSSRIGAPTGIEPLGLVCRNEGVPLNLADYALQGDFSHALPPVIAVVGGSMNAGKTTTVAAIVRGLTRKGLRVGAAKLTGTGAGGDMWAMRDAGAAEVVDFTDAGFATTFKASQSGLERSSTMLMGYLAAQQCDVIVVEIADGIYQQESSALIQSTTMQRLVDGYVYAAESATGAVAGVAWLRQHGEVMAVSGRLTMSPLACREAEQMTGLACIDKTSLERGDIPQNWLLTFEAQPSRQAL